MKTINAPTGDKFRRTFRCEQQTLQRLGLVCAFLLTIELLSGSESAKPIGDKTSAPAASASLLAPRWTNSLSMVFVAVPDTQTRFCIWETRVQDFAAFARATGYEPEENLALIRDTSQPKLNWRNPGFAQGPSHPVVMVNWEDARAFCAWLTQQEQKAGLIGTNQRYRLPTSAEWSHAVGPGLYPWVDVLPPPPKTDGAADMGTSRIQDERRFFPPPKGAGNYAGMEAWNPSEPKYACLRNYTDGFARTAPVGSFVPNRLGLYDLGGNVAEWCDDWFRKDMISPELEAKIPFTNQDGGGRTFRVVRGASWLDSNPAVIRSDLCSFELPDHGSDNIGFRVVLEMPENRKHP